MSNDPQIDSMERVTRIDFHPPYRCPFTMSCRSDIGEDFQRARAKALVADVVPRNDVLLARGVAIELVAEKHRGRGDRSLDYHLAREHPIPGDGRSQLGAEIHEV